MTEVEEQPEAIELGQSKAGIAPLFDEFCGLRRGGKEGLQYGCRIVVEAQIGGGELLFENGHAGKEGERPALGAVRRTQADLAFTVEKCARGAAADVFGKGQGSVVEINVEVGAVDGGAANVVDAIGIEADGMDAGVESARGLGTLGAEIGRL